MQPELSLIYDQIVAFQKFITKKPVTDNFIIYCHPSRYDAIEPELHRLLDSMPFRIQATLTPNPNMPTDEIYVVGLEPVRWNTNFPRWT